jgi:sterol desaturase/sphingolipid hydroxylase (fatty acid hydroxylase superfamily)
MARLDYLKEKADRYKIYLKFLLNTLLIIMVGLASLVFQIITKKIGIDNFWLSTIPLLIITFLNVIILAIVWQKSNDNEKEIEKE